MCEENIGFAMGDSVNRILCPPELSDSLFQFCPPDSSVVTNYVNACIEKSEMDFKKRLMKVTYCQMLGFTTCPVIVNEDQLIAHLTEEHFVDGTVGNNLIVEQSLLQEKSTGSILYRPHFLEAFETSFFLISGYDKFQGFFFWNVQKVSKSSDSSKFRARIELLSAHTAKNNIVWEAPVGSLRQDYDSMSCFIVKEEIMPEFQFSEVEQGKIVFCGGDNLGIDIPGWRMNVSITPWYATSEHKGVGETHLKSVPELPVCIPPIVRSQISPEGSRIFPVRHYGVNCNACGWENIQGIVFSCVDCLDFNICMFCMKIGCHEHHILICIMRPDLRRDVNHVLNGIRRNRFMDNNVQG